LNKDEDGCAPAAGFRFANAAFLNRKIFTKRELNQSLMFPSSIFATAFHKFPYVRKSAAELPTILTYRDAFWEKKSKKYYTFSGNLDMNFIRTAAKLEELGQCLR